MPSPALINLSPTFKKNKFSRLTSEPERSTASLPIKENLVFFITPLPKSISIESELFSSKEDSSIKNCEEIKFKASSESILLKLQFLKIAFVS